MMDVGYLENLKADTLQRDHSRLLGIIPKTQNEERTRQHGWVFCFYLSWSLIFILLDLASPLTRPTPAFIETPLCLAQFSANGSIHSYWMDVDCSFTHVFPDHLALTSLILMETLP